jgi:glycosyltransferase involved in cell wall biosynthesis
MIPIKTPVNSKAAITPGSIFEVFLEAPRCPTDNFVPLTPFMIHVWRQNGLPSESALEQPDQRERFVYWFYDTFHRLRTPYRWPVPLNTLQWLNHSALEVSSGFKKQMGRPPAQKYYLTRFMLHVWKHFGQGMNVQQSDGYLRFLTWFAVECIPAWNLPPSLLPDDLVSVLNQPIRPALPMSTAMQVLGELYSVPGICDLRTLPDDVILGMSFELLPYLLQTGDPRLVPAFMSQFWSGRVLPDPTSLTAYEYLAARACRPSIPAFQDSLAGEVASVRRWYAESYLPLVPRADVFSSEPIHCDSGLDCTDLNPSDKLVFVYRDHHTIAGLSKAGLLTKQALSRTGAQVVDCHFSFGRKQLGQEHTDNERMLRHARSSIHILNINPEYVPECLMCHLSTLDHAVRIIGQFYWELSDIGSAHECGLSLVDEIWVASRYLKEVYERRVSIPVYVMGQAVEVTAGHSRCTRATFGLPENSYMFLFSFDAGSVVERKNPLGAVRAFRKAFTRKTENAILVLKTRNLNAFQTSRDRVHWEEVMDVAAGDSRIRIIDQTMTTEELHGLQTVCDCYISLHRSEGFGYGPADAMALGKPVITTGYSGVVDFCTPETAALVDYVLEPVPDGAYPYMDTSREYYWASPDIDGAAQQMHTLYRDSELGHQLGQAGRKLILDQYSLEALQRRYAQRLFELGWS